MINAQAIHFAFTDQLQNEMMGDLKNRFILHAQTGKIVDVKEAAVVDVVRGHAPIREPVSLSFDQLMQIIETAGIAGSSIESAYIFFDEFGGFWGTQTQLRQSPLVNFLIAYALRSFFSRNLLTARKMIEG